MGQCKNRVVDGITIRPCRDCGKDLPLDQFRKMNRMKNGRIEKGTSNICRPCEKISYMRRYRRKYPPPTPWTMDDALAKAKELKGDEPCALEELAREIFHARQIAVKYRHVGG